MTANVVGQSGKTVTVATMADVNGETPSIPVATTSTAGTVIIGDNLTVDSSGKVSQGVATPSAFGVVKVGGRLTVSSGTINVPTANRATAGVVKVDTTLSFAQDGTIGAYSASLTTKGVVNMIPLIADLTAAPTQQDFNNLLAALKTAGIMSSE